MDSTDVKAASRRAGDHPALETAARIGYAVNGVLHIVIGVIALQLAFGSQGQERRPVGSPGLDGRQRLRARPALGRRRRWLGLALWQVTEAISGGWETSDRLKAAAKAVVYLVLSWTAFKFASGRGSSSKSQTTDFTAAYEAARGPVAGGRRRPGRLGVGVYHVVKGWKKKFLEDLETHPGEWIVKAGRFGYIAKGIALAIVGGLFVLAARAPQPERGPRASTGPCATSSARPAVPCCSLSSPSDSSPSASTASAALATPTSDAR